MKRIIFANISTKTVFVNVWAMLFFGVFFLFFPNYSLAAPNTDRLEGYWKFDNNATDLSGDGNTGVLSGANYLSDVPVTTFTNSASVMFPSLSSYVEMANQPGIQPSDTITFSMWVKLDQIPTATPQIIAGNYSDVQTAEGFKFSIDDTKVYFGIGNGSVFFPLAGNIYADTWFHLAGTWDHAILRLYLNGAEMSSASYAAALTYTGTSFKLGNFLGKMDDVRLYSRNLTSEEMSELASGNHTSINWDGSADIDYENVLNWDLEIIPDPYTIINIPNLTNEPSFTQAESVAGIKIATNSSLNIRSYNLTINDLGILDNNGNFILENISTQVLSGFINDTNSGTVTVAVAESGNTLKTGSQYYNLEINGAGSVSAQDANLIINGDLICNDGFFILQRNATISGNILLNGGSLSASALSPIALQGNWASQSAGLFAAGSGTVEFVGTDQSITGSSTFYNFTKNSSAADTLTFEAGSTQIILNTLDLSGGASDNVLSLRSTTLGTQWRLDPRGTLNIAYLDVKDSNNINATAINTAGKEIINSGNNTNWTFDTAAPSININSSSLYSSNPRYSVAGVATDVNSVSAVHFSTDSLTWLPCVADDGTFDEAEESFVCTPTSDLSDGAHTMDIRATDIENNIVLENDYSVVNFNIDTVVPILNSISSTPATSSVIVNWSTDENATSIVEYGTSSSYGQSIEQDSITLVQNHNVSISSLNVCTTYHFRIKSKDVALNQTVSTDQTFITSGCGDTITSDNSTDTSTAVVTVISSCDKEKPDEPEIVSAKAQDSNSIILEIDEADGEVDEYEIKYGTSNDNFQWSVDDIDEDELDSFVIGELSSGTTYYFKVRAKNECEKGDWSDEKSAKTDEKTVFDSENSQFPIIDKSEVLAKTTDTQSILENDTATALDNDPEPEIKPEPENENEDIDNNQNHEDAKKSEAPVTKECGSSGVEMIEDLAGGKKLKISGYGPPNATLKVYVYSNDPIVLSVKTDEDGNWSYVLDNELEDGEHQIYVAMTEDEGKIAAKSNPLVFIKTAQAVSIVNDPSSSPMEEAKNKFFIYAALISAVVIILALLIIGWRFRSQKTDEKLVA